MPPIAMIAQVTTARSHVWPLHISSSRELQLQLSRAFGWGFVTLSGATACERIRSDLMSRCHSMTNLLQHHTRNVKQFRGKQGICRRVDAKFEDEISRAGGRIDCRARDVFL